MATKPLSVEEMQEALDSYHANNCNKSAAARALKMPEATYFNRLKRAFDADLKPGKKYAKKFADLGSSTEIDILRDQISMLKRQIDSQKKQTLDEEFVKTQIFKLAKQTAEPPKWILERPKGETTGVPTLLCSDWHWGEVVDPAQVNGVNQYNLEIARNRAKNLVEITVDLLKNHINHKDYPGIVLCLGGDMVSGDIHEELTATNEKEMMPTIIDLWSVLVWVIETLAKEFGNVFVVGVSGNHGRNTHKIRAKGRNFTNFDWLVYQFLAKRFEAADNIKFHIPDGSDAFFQIYNHRYLLTHGDQFRGGDGMIGALGPIIRGDHKKRSRNAQINFEYDTLLLGHWHQLIQLQRLIVNGSLKGYDEYAYQNSFSFEPPRQALWITHPTKGITFSAPVIVERSKKLKTSDWVTWK